MIIYKIVKLKAISEDQIWKVRPAIVLYIGNIPNTIF